MTTYELNEKEAALIDALRKADPNEIGKTLAQALPNWSAREPEPEVTPGEPPTAAPAPARKRHKKSKFRLWLVAHGIELNIEHSGYIYDAHSLVIAINHRYYGVDVLWPMKPFRGVFTDELNTPHAEIAAEYKRNQQD